MVTVWGVFQFAVVKVRLAGETVPSAVLLEERPIVTLAVGWVLSRTVKVAVWPAPAASVVVSPEVGVTVIPAVSSSMLLTDTSAAFSPLYFASALVAAAVTIA